MSESVRPQITSSAQHLHYAALAAGSVRVHTVWSVSVCVLYYSRTHVSPIILTGHQKVTLETDLGFV